ncbi:YopJ family acetyltransferase [Rahnella woolbedingensis]|uniref:Uncharacterized protein n=1 Tax=Rahnella woolbedingensis TaxID=1510574 RepID=A0A419N1R2_9GAMM|nr:YopJ family acetyltransferase [Rahnella woolbedingensis]RJT31856.1 hypothetical protein D6C13_24830 [Rahnella woolbedingensis]
MKRSQFKSARPTSLSLTIPSAAPPPPVREGYLPPKLHKAVSANLIPGCPPEAASLHQHLHTAQDHIVKGWQPDIEVTLGDRAIIQTLINSENIRQPGLQLTYYSSLTAFADWLIGNKSICHQHVRAIVATAENRHHHYYIDCYFTAPGQPSSLIFLESATVMHPMPQTVLSQFQQRLDSGGMRNLRIAVIDTCVQSSPADCVIFCLSFALKSLKQKAVFISMHQQHCTTYSLRPHYEPIPSFDFDIFPIYPCALLPPDFLRHTHSRRLYQSIFEQLPPDERQDAANRLQSLYQERDTAEGRRQYLVSIEHKRLQLLRRALIQMGAIANM